MRTLCPGRASGPLLVLAEPISFWGGVDGATGEIIDIRHPQRGTSLAGRVVALASGRGSSSSSSVLAELIRVGRAPAALLLEQPDPILVLGVLAASELYGAALPVVVLDNLPSGSWAEVDASGPEPMVTVDGRPVA